MERVNPMLWTMFGFSVASAIHLPMPGIGGFAAFCALWLFVAAVIAESYARRN